MNWFPTNATTTRGSTSGRSRKTEGGVGKIAQEKHRPTLQRTNTREAAHRTYSSTTRKVYAGQRKHQHGVNMEGPRDNKEGQGDEPSENVQRQGSPLWQLTLDVAMGSACSRKKYKLLMRGLFINVLVSHGEKDINILVNVRHLCRGRGVLYSLDRGNLALHHHGSMAFFSSRERQRSCRCTGPVKSLHGLLCNLHCVDLVCCTAWMSTTASAMSCIGKLCLCRHWNVHRSDGVLRLRRQHCLLDSLQRETVTSKNHTNVHRRWSGSAALPLSSEPSGDETEVHLIRST